MTTTRDEAKDNLLKLSNNPYPGRGIIMGIDGTGKNVVQIYWIMGRSENSRNRIFVAEDGRVHTALLKPDKNSDTSLTIYNAMVEQQRLGYVVSNGIHTDAVMRHLSLGGGLRLEGVLNNLSYEPDAPHFTPRITGVVQIHEGSNIDFHFSLIRRSSFNPNRESLFYRSNIMDPGFGYFISTYSGDGNPLPSWRGEPMLMPLVGSIDSLSVLYWTTLNRENIVALAVKFIDISTGMSAVNIVNKDLS